jgi:glycosyltransferase involved in cell wall biosynthesis
LTNVIQVIPTLERGGAEAIVIRLCAKLNSINMSTKILVLSNVGVSERVESNHVDVSKVQVVDHYQKGFMSGNWFVGMIKWFFRNRDFFSNVDIVHLHLTKSLFLCLLLKLEKFFKLSGGAKLPLFVFTVHGVGSRQTLVRRIFNRITIPLVDVLVLVAEDNYWTKFANRFSKSGKITLVIKNGIELKGSRKFIPEKKAAKMITVGTLTRLNKDRMPEIFIDLAKELVVRGNSDIQFLIGGAGPLFESLQHRVKQESLEKIVLFKGKILITEEFFDLLDLFVSINTGETTGVAALEAIDAGVPVISYQRLEGYEPNQDSWIWSTGNLEELAEAILSIVDTEKGLTRLIQNQSRFLHDNFSEEVMLSSYLKAYNNTGKHSR